MRIDKIEIDGFGKLNNCEYTFADGVNLIYGENESGKSTLCEFVLSAFYGLPNESKKTADDMPARKKYRPWNSEAFGGRVYFTDDDGRKLVIERSFKATKRGDKTTLRDAKSWEELDNSDNLGEKLFGLSREAFLKTLYVKSFGADSLKKDDGEILSRLLNLETSGDEDVSYSKIINSMEKEIFGLKTKTGRGGKISMLQEKEQALKQELTISKMTYSALLNDEETVKSLKKTAKDMEEEAKALDKRYELALLHEKYLQGQKIAETKDVIEKRIASAEEKLEQLNVQTENIKEDDCVFVSADEISRARALETKKLIAEEKLLSLNCTAPQSDKKMNPLWSMPLLVIGLVLLIAGFVKPNTLTNITGALVMLFGTCVLAYAKLKNKQRADVNEKQIKDAENELIKIQSELDGIFLPYGVKISDELSALYMNKKSTEEKKAELDSRINELKAEIEMLKKSLPEDKEEIEISEEAKNYSQESSDVLYTKINLLKSESRQMAERAAEIDIKITKETAEIRRETDILAELDGISDEIALLEKRYKALTTAVCWLERAHDEIKNNFAPKLNEKTSYYLSVLTNKKYCDVKTNDSFLLNLKSTEGEIVEAGFMSRGTYDLLYISLRFALMSVITDGKIPPVILDDAFSQLDDSRLTRAVDLVTENDEFSQVMLFTCHENYKELLGNSGVNVIEL